MTSGGFLKGLRGKASSLGHKIKDKAKTLKDKAKDKVKGLKSKAEMAAAAAALGGIGAAGLGAASHGAFGSSGSSGSSGGNLIIKIIILVIATAFFGVFLSFIHTNQSTLGIDNTKTIMSVVAVIGGGLVISRLMHVGIIDFIISSEVNILAIYLLLSYFSLTTSFTGGFFPSLSHTFHSFWSYIKDPSTLFTNGFTPIISVVLFLIPLFILLADASQNMMLGLITILVGAAVVAILYPSDINPITLTAVTAPPENSTGVA